MQRLVDRVYHVAYKNKWVWVMTAVPASTGLLVRCGMDSAAFWTGFAGLLYLTPMVVWINLLIPRDRTWFMPLVGGAYVLAWSRCRELAMALLGVPILDIMHAVRLISLASRGSGT